MPAEPGWWAETVGEHFADRAAAAVVLKNLGFPDETKTWPISRLSTGERLRLALVRALMMRPKVLLLDEPTAALDAASVAAVESLIAAEMRAGLAVLWVTHDPSQARRIADRQLVMEAGCLREERGRARLHLSELRRTRRRECARSDRRRPLLDLSTGNSSQPAGGLHPNDGAARACRHGADGFIRVVSPLWTGLAALGMILFAGHEVSAAAGAAAFGLVVLRLGYRLHDDGLGPRDDFALLTALRPSPWYDPRYAIPLLGMILGNCMTGIALGLDTLTTGLVSRRASVEAQLMLGATRWAGRCACHPRCASQRADAND